MNRLHTRRFEIDRILKEEVRIKTGDVFFRLGNESFYGLPFSKLVALATRSLYSHASVALVEDGEIWLIEVALDGTQQLRFIDWVDFCATADVEVWRPNAVALGPDFARKIEGSCKQFLESDADYNLAFRPQRNRFYCTESVEFIFRQAGVLSLCEPVVPKDVLSPFVYRFLFSPINWLVGKLTGASIPTDVPAWVVGNEQEKGLLASPYLYPIFKHS